MTVPVRSTNNVVWQCAYHVVWCTKYRRKLLDQPVEARLKELVAEVCLEKNATVRAFEIMPDYCHLLVEVDPQFGIHRLVKGIKGRSSRVLRSEFRGLTSRVPTLWTNSYFVATAGGAPLAQIRQYVEAQKEV
jgi:putative transposase